MTATRFSEAWFDEALDLVAPLPERPGVACAVAFEAGATRWHLVVEQGRVTRWGLGSIEHPELVLRLSPDTAEMIHRPGCDGTEALAGCMLVEADDSESVPSPLDIGARPEPEALPTIPGATLTVQYHLSDGPFGDVDIWWSFESGRSRAMELGTAAVADVEVWVPFQRVAPLRSGEISILEAIEGDGRVEGSEGPLMLYAGLEESPEMQAVGRSCGPSAAVFGSLGLVTNHAVFEEALIEMHARQP